MTAGRRAVFLDRDGTIIEDVGYPREARQVHLLEGAAGALRSLRDAGFQLVIVGNQSGIGRGLVTEAQARAVHERLVAELTRRGVALDAVKYCPHAPWEHCRCRKPSPDLLLAAGHELGVEMPASYMVGDKPSDIEAGRRAGCRTVFFARDGGAHDTADHVATSWRDVVGFISGAAAAA